jgi:hypothetical protein
VRTSPPEATSCSNIANACSCGWGAAVLNCVVRAASSAARCSPPAETRHLSFLNFLAPVPSLSLQILLNDLCFQTGAFKFNLSGVRGVFCTPGALSLLLE